jgi:S1-C subfamily serine protease
VQRGWLGVTISSVNSDLAKANDLRVNEGAYVSGFAEMSSAKEAGIKEGDVVIQIDDTPIKSNTALIEYIGRHRPGDRVNMLVNRNGKEVSIPVMLKSRDGTVGVVKPVVKDAVTALGVELEEVDTKVLKKLDLNHGVRIKDLGNGKLSKYTDMRTGFIVTKINDVPVESIEEFTDILAKKRKGDLVIFSGTYEEFPREFNYAFRM